jgi:hypothetical protein
MSDNLSIAAERRIGSVLKSTLLGRRRVTPVRSSGRTGADGHHAACQRGAVFGTRSRTLLTASRHCPGLSGRGDVPEPCGGQVGSLLDEPSAARHREHRSTLASSVVAWVRPRPPFLVVNIAGRRQAPPWRDARR